MSGAYVAGSNHQFELVSATTTGAVSYTNLPSVSKKSTVDHDVTVNASGKVTGYTNGDVQFPKGIARMGATQRARDH